ncbi:zinc finger protein ZPR1 [Halyomorpha halys]|uniref:zinc finger protein ZPR1 n=1 Tax=Halyomorpha halys TaxID=286706 RepID=UPI0006D527F4|nr:zinc finger protein ZPR1 [Halyomorpha halys]
METNGVANHAKRSLFSDLDPDEDITQIESLCVTCGKNGITRILLTKIPFYKQVVLMSFECLECGYRNNEIQSAGKVEEKGVRITLSVEAPEDFNRQVVKSDYTSIKLPILDFEVPSQSQKGEVTTVEGIINRAIGGLIRDYEVRKPSDPETADKIKDFVDKLFLLKTLTRPFVLIIEDISGHSCVENPKAPKPDPNCHVVHFDRSKSEDHILGIYTKEEIGEPEGKDESLLPPLGESEEPLDLEAEVLRFPTNCPICGTPTTTNMKLTKIPYFKEVVIMATNCDSCGYRTNEIKSGAGMEPRGVKIEVTVSSREDFSRDLLKSETCSVLVPELELEAGPFVVGGKFTTVEGLLTDLKTGLERSVLTRDTLQAEVAEALSTLAKRLDKVLATEEAVTLVLDDPAGNSFVQSLTAPDPDPRLKITHYERSYDQNEDLGLNDMNTENYE